MITTRDTVFDRVAVDHLTKDGSRVYWRLRDDFADPQPHIFQLQTGESGVPEADDWTDVGDPVTDVFQAVDDTQREFAISQTSHYRVVLTTDLGEYISQPASCWARLSRHDWLNARAVARRELLRHRVDASEPGWLFKRRKLTPVVTDPNVVDPLTGEVIKTMNTVGIGTGRLGGYFDPVPFWIDQMPGPRYARRDENRGHVDDIAAQGRCLGFPQLDHNDVWASATGDARFALHKVTPVASIKNVPVVVEVEMRRLSPTDPIFELPLPPAPKLQTVERAEI